MTPRALAAAAALGGAALFASACTIEIGSGETVAETYEVGDFSRISVDRAWTARVDVGPETSVEVQVDKEALDNVDIRVEGDTLIVDLEGGLFSISGDLDVHITTPELVGLKADGASQVDIDDLDADRFELDVDGASQVTADGDVGELVIQADGASQIDFDRVTVASAEVDGNGASQIGLTAAAEVRGRLDGASQLDVSDTTSVDVATNGASSVNRR